MLCCFLKKHKLPKQAMTHFFLQLDGICSDQPIFGGRYESENAESGLFVSIRIFQSKFSMKAEKQFKMMPIHFFGQFRRSN